MPSNLKTGTSKMTGKTTCNIQKLGTVESRHREQVDKFSQMKKDLPAKKRHLKTLQKKLKACENDENADHKEIREYEEKIEELQTLINNIENCTDEYQYLMDVGPLLFKYYDDLKNPVPDRVAESTIRKKSGKISATTTTTTTTTRKAKTGGRKPSISKSFGRPKDANQRTGLGGGIGLGGVGLGGLRKPETIRNPSVSRPKSDIVINKKPSESYGEFNLITQTETIEETSSTGTKSKKLGQTKIGPVKKPTGISDYFGTKTKENNGETRFEMLDDFLSKTDPNWVKKSKNNNSHAENICDDCGVLKLLIHRESKLVCPECGVESMTLIDSDRISYKDPPPEMNYFAYRRINHFNELLVQFQAKESTNIPKEVYEMILKELKKERKTVKHLNYNLVKKYLKKYSKKGYNQYYDHIFYIIYRLNGEKPLTMTPEMEEKLRYWFLQIQDPFEKYCPADRKNFISYNFVFYKFCEMLGYYEFLKYFPLLKSKEKRYDQEKIWEKIIADIGLI